MQSVSHALPMKAGTVRSALVSKISTESMGFVSNATRGRPTTEKTASVISASMEIGTNASRAIFPAASAQAQKLVSASLVQTFLSSLKTDSAPREESVQLVLSWKKILARHAQPTAGTAQTTLTALSAHQDSGLTPSSWRARSLSHANKFVAMGEGSTQNAMMEIPTMVMVAIVTAGLKLDGHAPEELQS